MAGEKHPPQIQPGANFGEKMRLPTARSAGGAIGDPITAHEHHIQVRCGGEYGRQGAQHDMKAAIGFQIARHEGQYPTAATRPPAAPRGGEGEARSRIGAKHF
jgi:hypothetical protein